MITYGDLRIHPLPEGRFTVGEDKAFVPHLEGDPMRPGTLFISVTPFLVETPSALLLLDTGLGEYASGRDVTFLLDGIRRAGFEREDVTRVLLSHLHLDHSGGCVTDAGGIDVPTFPNAVYVVQRAEAEESTYAGASAEARRRVVHALAAAGQLDLVDGSQRLTDEIELQHTGGHTEHHQAIRITSGGRVAVFGGDVLPAPSQATRSFRAKYDVDGQVAQDQRRRIAADAAENGHLLLFYHSTSQPAGFIAEERSGLRVEPVGSVVL